MHDREKKPESLSIIREALNNARERSQELQRKVTDARKTQKEAEEELRIASDALKECYTEIATLKSIIQSDTYSQSHTLSNRPNGEEHGLKALGESEANNSTDLNVTTVEQQYLGAIPALYEEGFAAYYW